MSTSKYKLTDTMLTSNTQTGKATEAVMAKVHLHAPELTTAQYNAIYEDVAKELEFRLAKKGDAIVRPQGGGIMF